MELITLVRYMIWADEKYLNYVGSLSEKEYQARIPGYDNSISQIMNHMCGVYWEWIHFITDQDYSDEPEWDSLSKEDHMRMIRDSHEEILLYCNSKDLSKLYTMHWNETDNPAETTAENVIFNFVTHQAYHRGQLAIYLRFLGIEEIEETDFNPYIYNSQQSY